MTRYTGRPPLPERINRLEELAVDLWWSWHRDARLVFRRLDLTVWRATAHNPVRMNTPTTISLSKSTRGSGLSKLWVFHSFVHSAAERTTTLDGESMLLCDPLSTVRNAGGPDVA